MTAMLLGLLFLAPADVQEQEHALSKDKTGMKWVLPFTSARKASTKNTRLLLIKPVAFGTSKDGGW